MLLRLLPLGTELHIEGSISGGDHGRGDLHGSKTVLLRHGVRGFRAFGASATRCARCIRVSGGGAGDEGDANGAGRGSGAMGGKD